MERGLTTSFFVTEFGNKWKAIDLLYEFKELREIEEVVIPPRKDKFGRRYIIVRFLNVKYENLLATKLNNIVLYGRKLFDNLPRFQRVKVAQERIGRKEVVKKPGGNQVREQRGYRRRNFVGGKSYAEVLQNTHDESKPKTTVCNKKTLVFSPNEDDTFP